MVRLSDGFHELKETFDLSQKVLILKFCHRSCSMPICEKFQTVANMYPELTFARVKVSEFPVLIEEFDVNYTPTFIALFDDKVMEKRVDTRIDGLLDMVERLSTINPLSY